MKRRMMAGCAAVILAMAMAGCGSTENETKTVETTGIQNDALDEGASADETAVESEAAEVSAAENAETEAIVYEDKDVYQIGDVWNVDGKWRLVVTGVSATELRLDEEETDMNPEVVYVVDYYYVNNGYTDIYSDMLQLDLDYNIVDSQGAEGYAYYLELEYYPQPTPIGVGCKAQACIGLEHDGEFKLSVDMYDNDGELYSALFSLDPSVEATEAAMPGMVADTEAKDAQYMIGDTWTVDGQWELTITDVKEMDERNEYASFEPEAVYMIEYTYKNLGYDDDFMDGLYMNPESGVVDCENVMGYSYPFIGDDIPMEIAVGETCKAQAFVAVEHKGDFKLYYEQYDSNEELQRAIFGIHVD